MDFSNLIRITSEDFNALKNDLILMEESYFGAPYEEYKFSAKIDYKETIRLINVARNLNKLNIKLNQLYEDFLTFVGGGSQSSALDGAVSPAVKNTTAIDSVDRSNNNVYMATSSHDDLDISWPADDSHIAWPAGAPDSVSGYNGGYNGDLNSNFAGNSIGGFNTNYNGGFSGQPVLSGYGDERNFYNDIIFGLQRELPLALSTSLDLHGKESNINITKDLFKKIVFEILNYEKNYNRDIFSPTSLYNVLKSDILNNGKEVLLPYVISNVLTYLKDSNFIGYYGANNKQSFSVLDKEGLKLWANSIL